MRFAQTSQSVISFQVLKQLMSDFTDSVKMKSLLGFYTQFVIYIR